jgi:hypothetical protein
VTAADDDDTVAGRRGEDATVVSFRRSPEADPPASGGPEASETEDETVIRPRASARASTPEEPAVPPSPPRRVASSGQPDNAVYRPRPADPVIVPRTQH